MNCNLFCHYKRATIYSSKTRKMYLYLSFLTIAVIFSTSHNVIDCEEKRETFSQHTTNSDTIIFVILSQENSFHNQQAEELKRHMENQAVELNLPSIHVLLTHIQWPNEVGTWTIFPLIEKFFEKSFSDAFPNIRWVLICEEGTRINLVKFIDFINTLDHQKHMFVGRALRDSEATIIHHFAFHEHPTSFEYPDLAAGILFSWSLILGLYESGNYKLFVNDLNFSIDPQHELALFLRNEGNGMQLMHNDAFCADENEHCITFYVLSKIPICVKPVPRSDIFFAVKTCKKYEERVTVLLETWASPKLDLTFFGDVANDTHGQNIVNLNIENTDRGHCGKTMGILHYVAGNQKLRSKSWLVITDDDTLLSVRRLRNQLSCYNSMEKIAIGQRYGYRTAMSEGYDYMTGGAGMILSMKAVKFIVKSGSCKCPTADTPDDMYLGICLQKLQIPVIHSPYFHQARPNDYSRELLKHQEPVTFHKFWMIDPIEVYKEWLTDELPTKSYTPHNEL